MLHFEERAVAYLLWDGVKIVRDPVLLEKLLDVLLSSGEFLVHPALEAPDVVHPSVCRLLGRGQTLLHLKVQVRVAV